MKTFQDYLTEAEYLAENPAIGDGFAIEIAREEIVLESYVVDIVEDGIVIEADDTMMRILKHVGYLTEDSHMSTAKGARRYNFETSPDTDLEEQQSGSSFRNPRFAGLEDELNAATGAQPAQASTTNSLERHADQFKARAQAGEVGTPTQWSQMSDIEKRELRSQGFGPKPTNEAEYRGRNVPLGKKMKGDVKKSKVYVRKPNGNVVKVEFGDPNMRIKKSNPARRRSFRARHNCDNPGPRWKARYWSCRSW